MNASEFYTKGQSDRKTYEDRAESISKVTIPYLIRTEGSSGSTEMEDSNSQSFGARLVNTLKAKMGMALLPPSTSSFRYVPDPEEMAALTEGNADNNAKVKNLLSTASMRVNDEIEIQQIRSSLFDLIAQLIVVGSCVVEKVKKKGVILYPLKSFVVELDQAGNPLGICTVETIAKQNLPKDIKPKEEKEEYELYTYYYRESEKSSEKWIRKQEIEGEEVGSEKTYKNYDAMSVRYFGWTWMVGDSYHRPYAEDYYKDLQQLDKTAGLLTDGSLIAAKSLIFVNERGGRTRKDEVADSANGDVIDGVAEDVTAFQFGKNYDFQVAMEREANMKNELKSAFLMNESATRDAERVTKYEVMLMAKELESSTLAGIYSKLAIDWSKWIVIRIMDEINIKFDTVNVEILTGLDALGRSQESQNLDAYLQRMGAMGMMDWVNEAEIASRYAEYDGIDTNNLLKTPEEVADARQKAADQAAANAGVEAAAIESGKNAGASEGNPQQPPPQ